MASLGFVRVRAVHQSSLVQQYRRLLGEKAFWMKRGTHPRTAAELERLDATLAALAAALPLVFPGVKVAELGRLPYVPAVPFPSHALTRVVLAGLRRLGTPTLDQLTQHIVEDHSIDTQLHDFARLAARIRKVLDRLAAKGSIRAHSGATHRWSLLS